MKNLLSSYHGSLLLKNIPELTDKDLLAVLGSSYDHLTVKETQQKLANILSAESVFLQFKKFQEEFRKGTIIT